MIPVQQIWHFLVIANSVEDLQWLASYLNKYKEDYTLTEHWLFQLAIKDILEVFI
jgi:putative IMPACT (imprinted ancient) family translation regulator